MKKSEGGNDVTKAELIEFLKGVPENATICLLDNIDEIISVKYDKEWNTVILENSADEVKKGVIT